jgi:RNA recognition motif-containing protein
MARTLKVGVSQGSLAGERLMSGRCFRAVRNSVGEDGEYGRRRETMHHKLLVGNLPYATTVRDLYEIFSPAGMVMDVELLFDNLTGRSYGTAYVDMETAADARRAIERLNGKQVSGRPIKVDEARE